MTTESSIKILHASDLHISTQWELRSPLDRLSDLENPFDLSVTGLIQKGAIASHLVTSWWKRLAASSYDPDVLEALAEFIYNNAKKKSGAGASVEQLDAVILTGDLGTTGTKDDMEKVAQFLSADFDPRCPHRGKDKSYKGATLRAVEIPVIILPGNHDRYTPTRQVLKKKFPIFFYPGATHFDEVLSAHWSGPIQSIDLLSDDKRLRVTILCADFTLEKFDDHEGFYGWLAQGRVYSNIRRELLKATYAGRQRKDKDEIVCVLWAVHFPPGFPVKKSCGLLGEATLIKLANQMGVSGVLAGHTHKQLIYRNPAMSFDGFCCGTTTQFEPMSNDPARGNLLEIISITADASGSIKITPRHFRYSVGEPDNGPRLMQWMEVPG